MGVRWNVPNETATEKRFPNCQSEFGCFPTIHVAVASPSDSVQSEAWSWFDSFSHKIYYQSIMSLSICGPAYEAALSVAPSVCRSICLVPLIYLKSESLISCKCGGDITLDTWLWEQTWGHKVKGQGCWERKYKDRFCAYLREKSIDLHQIKTKMILSWSYTHTVEYTQTAKMNNFCDICLSLTSHTFRSLDIGTL